MATVSHSRCRFANSVDFKLHHYRRIAALAKTAIQSSEKLKLHSFERTRPVYNFELTDTALACNHLRTLVSNCFALPPS